MIEDPEIGTLKFYLKYWMHPELGEELGFHELTSEICDPAKMFTNDVADGKQETLFFPLNPVSEDDFRSYGPKLKCIKDPFKLFGNFNSNAASNLMVVFEKCDPSERTCKSEEAYVEWMKGKYILTLQNEVKFQSHVFDTKDRLISESSTQWYNLSSVLRLDYVNMVQRSELELSDVVYGIGGLFTAAGLRGFVLEDRPSRFMIYERPVQNAITFEISRNRDIYHRNVYTILDLLSEVGGFFGAIAPFCQGLVLMFQYDGVHTFVMSALFFTGNPFSKHNDERKNMKESEDHPLTESMRSDTMRYIQWNCCRMLSINFQRFCARSIV